MILKYKLFSCPYQIINNVWLVEFGKKHTLYVYHTINKKKCKTTLKRGINFDDASILSSIERW